MFRFTIRDLLWLMVVMGLAVAWLVDRTVIENRCEDQVVIAHEAYDIALDEIERAAVTNDPAREVKKAVKVLRINQPTSGINAGR